MTTGPMPAPASAPPRSKGRSLFWAGIGVAVLGIGLAVGQYALKMLIVPWYVPVLTTFGAILLLCSLWQRRGVSRMIMFGLIVVLAAFQWFFLLSLTRLPTYEGPAQAGQKIPAFQTILADGTAFTDRSLEDGTPSALIFFRGRW